MLLLNIIMQVSSNTIIKPQQSSLNMLLLVWLVSAVNDGEKSLIREPLGNWG